MTRKRLRQLYVRYIINDSKLRELRGKLHKEIYDLVQDGHEERDLAVFLGIHVNAVYAYVGAHERRTFDKEAHQRWQKQHDEETVGKNLAGAEEEDAMVSEMLNGPDRDWADPIGRDDFRFFRKK